MNRSRKFGKYIFGGRPYVLLTLAISLAGCGDAFNYTGYCRSEGRYFSDDEYIKLALGYEVEAKRTNLDVSDLSVRLLREQDPTCCSVDHDPNSKGVIERLVGYHFVDVNLHLRLEGARRTQLGEYYEAHVLIGPCGQVLDTYGFGRDAKH